MKLIIFPLSILILLALSVQMFNLVPMNYTNTYGTLYGSTNEQLISLGVIDTTFNITLMGGFLSLFATVAGIGIATGLNISVFGSTVRISQRSQNIIYNSMFYGGLWGMFSVLATVGINGLGLFSIEIFGALFYLVLTLFYVLGINQQIQHDQSGD